MPRLAAPTTMNLKRAVLFALRWCGSCALTVFLWAVWLMLVAGIGFQVWIVTHRELSLPDFALRAIERRLAASEVTARFGRAVFDPTGWILFENVQLFGPDRSVPLVTVRSACVKLEFWPLLAGDLRVHEVRLTGFDLRIPAMLSPSGTDEAVVSDLDGFIQARRSDYNIAVCTFRIAGVAVTGRGGFHLPESTPTRPGSIRLLDFVLERYLKAGRRLIELRPQIEALVEPRLELTFAPSPDRGAVVSAELLVDSSHPDAACTVLAARVRTEFPLLGGAPAPVTMAIDAQDLTWKEQAQVSWLHVDVAGSLVPDQFEFHAQTARLTAAGGRVMGIPFAAPSVELALARWPWLRGDAVLQAGDAAVEAHADVEIKKGQGRLDLSGALTPDLLRTGAARFGMTPAKWVTLTDPAPLKATIELAAGWKPVRIEGDVSVRRAVAHDVPIDAAGGHFVCVGHAIQVTDVRLIQGDNAAYGSYSMDTATRDYRFLLQGRLRPFDISGWFPEWWPHFWRNFDFAAAPAAADIDITGRWGTAKETSIFCYADAAAPGIRGVPFDRVRTTFFFRPGYFEAIRFNAERAGHAGRGSFAVVIDYEDSTYRTIDFDAVSDLDVSDCARIYGPAGAALAAPLQFGTPPLVFLNGHLDGPDTPGGPHAHIRFGMTENNRFTVHGFPLDSVKFSASYTDGNLDARDIETGFAGGMATGNARVEGPPDDRTVAFDARLAGADLARVAGILDEFQSAGKPPASDRPRDRPNRHAPGGSLDVRLTASGRLFQPFSFHGDGHLSVAGQELGEIQLLGQLSELLSKTLLNFTSLRLDSAQADFRLEGNKVVFPQVKLQGPRASIDAKGEYLLDARTLDFNARIFPLQESKFILADALGALLTPLSNVLELKLKGPLAKPSWSFAFGPTNFLRALTRPANGGPPVPNAPVPPPPLVTAPPNFP